MFQIGYRRPSGISILSFGTRGGLGPPTGELWSDPVCPTELNYTRAMRPVPFRTFWEFQVVVGHCLSHHALSQLTHIDDLVYYVVLVFLCCPTEDFREIFDCPTQDSREFFDRIF